MSIKCPVCLDPFDSKLKVPKCLDCGHTVCRKCIIRASKSDRYNCPVCRRPIGDKTADEMPTNYALIPEDMLYSQESQLSSYIENVQIPEWRPILPNSKRNSMNMICKHHNKPLSKMCSCGQAVCGNCILSERHKGHAAQSLDPMFFVPISIFAKEKLRAFAKENENLYQIGVDYLEGANSFWSKIRACNDKTLECFTCINKEEIAEDFHSICNIHRNLHKKEIEPLYEAIDYLQKRFQEDKRKVLRCLEEIMEHCPEKDRKATSEEATWLVNSIPILKSNIRKVCELKRDLDILEHRNTLIPQPFTEDDIRVSHRSLCGFNKSGNLLRHKSQGLSKNSPVLVCWNNNVTHLLQETLLYTFWFYGETFDSKELMLEGSAKEYVDLLRMSIVASKSDDKLIYLVGGFNKQRQKETASCFIIDTDRILPICPLNSPKSSVSTLFFGNYIYAFGGRITDENSIYKPLAEIERYCLPLDVWVVLDFSLIKPRYDARAISISEKVLGGSEDEIIIFGGFNFGGEFVNQMESIKFINDVYGTANTLSEYFKPSENVIKCYAYKHNNRLYTITGSQFGGVEEQKNQIRGPEYLFMLQKYTLKGSLIEETMLGRGKVEICEDMAEHEGVIYEFWPKLNEKKGGTWGRPRIFSIETGEERSRSDLAELMYTISSA